MQNEKVDVIIIGGGVIGVCIAYYAASEGASVLVLDKNGIGSGSSHGNAGLLVAGECRPLPSPGVISDGLRYLSDPDGPLYIRFSADFDLMRWLWKFCRSCNEKHLHHSIGIFRKLGSESLALHEELAQAGGASYEYRHDGLLTLFTTEKSISENREYSARVRSYGIETEVLSGEEVRERVPAAGPGIVGGLLRKIDGCLDPAAFVGWLAGEAESRGVMFLPGTEVFWLETGHRRVTRVVTTRGDFAGEQVVLAAGAWNHQLARYLRSNVPLQPAKGYSLTFHRPENAPEIPLLLEEARVAVTPFADSLRLAGTLELAGMDLVLSRRRLKAIEAQTYRYLPRLGGMEIKEIWRGLRPCTPDGLPIFGWLRPYDNVLIAGGHGTKGMLLGPVTGKYVSRMLGGQSIGMMERSLRPNRF
jgi:D-amino-acid dehydrogenase